MIGMSATLPNLDSLAKWLDASLYQTNYRPIPLVECIKNGNTVFDSTFTKLRTIEINKHIENDQDLLLHLTYETIHLQLGVLIFCPTKMRCETLAENIARMVYSMYEGSFCKFLVFSTKRLWFGFD
jgi:DNA polymerase theta